MERPRRLLRRRSTDRRGICEHYVESHHGEGVDDSTGDNFLPHVIIVNRGEDVVGRISSFCQQGPRSICILSAHGTISHVIVRQAISCSSTMTYEGLFEILSLSGSFTVTPRGRSGGLSITLAGPDDRVFGGLVAGSLTAASTVQIVVGSFQMSSTNELKMKFKFDQSTLFEVPITFLNEVGITIKSTSETTHENERYAVPMPSCTLENEIGMTSTEVTENEAPVTPTFEPKNEVSATPTLGLEKETLTTLPSPPDIANTETLALAVDKEDGEAPGSSEDYDPDGSWSSMGPVFSCGSPSTTDEDQ
ncbi:hypothetical protein Syun_016435 [Stephania yunnanensis]|uniref:AT-hook motif nuclear-localized protein n=1 Tax=Stephania yunnanensis TaxID=152371 RepID=A0AAP0J7A7_9MAGN